MAVVKHKPTSPGSRFVIRVRTEGLHKGQPHRPLVENKKMNGGRNNQGRITQRHAGGGHKQRYR
ncbi:MAG: 50S ribosomal protein L2, partial [Methylococcales bacterium]